VTQLGSQFKAGRRNKRAAAFENIGNRLSGIRLSRLAVCGSWIAYSAGGLDSIFNELIHHHRYATRADAKAAIQEYIESFYNRQRRHSRLGYVPPALFAEAFSQQQQAA
jgi:transposase InsO family protein